ncbi:T9SS type A sorting domain-containing protein [Cognataquiflexum rubidum]|uniref:T9SS type A sorting domain-containing protein n=1 Tax=Cognataquiflexum rubidum TaxID=2922273 RepID=UPI001F12A34B|nr:T9SS type A sorting domain-containing protein [Cognataquiflexum rubidum]MCH6232700.1 T9SS type A sorting domain-containing protein [Cognataquiflexum rubidum]
MKLIFIDNWTFCFLKSIGFNRTWIVLAFLFISNLSFGEGSGNWGTESNRQSFLWYPSNTGSGGFGNRGYMLLPSNVSGYNSGHRLYVYVKAGETVFWGFRRVGTTGNIRVRWFYDANSTGFFPTGTSGTARTMISSRDYNPSSSGETQGRPGSASSALNGPSQITGSGYSAFSFENNTGAARAFWVEISNTSNGHITDGFNINFWDISVASGSSGAFTERTGRVYSRFWSIANSRPDPSTTALMLTKSSADNFSFHNNFGFYVPVDNTFTASGDDYFVKYINFGGSSGGWTNFFANKDGPRNDLTFEENRKSRSGTSSNFQYPLFVSEPDISIWKSTAPPSASLIIDYEPKLPPDIGGEATVNLTISLPAVVDVLIDLNGNMTYDAGTDLLISEKYDAPGTYQIYWNGEDADGNVVPADSDVEVVATVIFFPVHFPIFDLEQSLGMRVSNVRPGTPGNNSIFWDDSLISRTGLTPSDSPQSLMVNTIGVLGPDHKWWATGDNGFSNNITINTWAGSYNTEVQGSFRILPVQWLYFRGKSIEERIRLEWGTAQEKDNEKFIIQRSKDGRSWTEISQVKGEGNSEKPVYYLGWDNSPMVGPNYYRLRQLDFDGKEEYTSVIKVDFIPDWEIHLYPNPVADQLFIQTKKVDKLEVVLVDSQGTKIPLQPKLINADKLEFDVKDLSAGLYLVYIYNEEKILVKKLIKRD